MNTLKVVLCSLLVLASSLSLRAAHVDKDTLGSREAFAFDNTEDESPEEIKRISRPQPASIYSDPQFDYYGLVSLGNQPFKVIFDTDLSQTWLPSIDCSEYECGNLLRFDANISTTYQPANNGCKIDYDTTSGSGRLGRDDLQLAGVKLNQHSFCEVTKVRIGSSGMGQAYDGIVGLGLSGSKSIVQRMVEQKLIKEALFTYYLDRDPKSWPSGEVNFGAIQDEHYEGKIEYVALSNSSRWQIKVDGFNLGEDYGYDYSFDAVMSSRSLFISGPVDEIKAINEALGFERIRPEYFGSQDCDAKNYLNVTFVIGGKNYTLTPDQFMIRLPKEWTAVNCLSAFKLDSPFRQPTENPWTFGSAFLGTVYSVFDETNKRIGFAPMYRDSWFAPTPRDHQLLSNEI